MLFRKKVKNEMESISVDDKNILDWLGIKQSDTYIKGESCLKQTTVFSCIKILSDNISKLPIKIYQNNDGIQRVSNHYLEYLLKLRPNEYMSASDFWKSVEVQRNIYGNAYVALEFNNKGQVTGLYPLESSNMQIFVDNTGLLGSNNTMWYLYTDNIGVQHKFMSNEILHFKGLTSNGLIGLSVIEQLQHLVESGKSSEVYLSNFFKNGLQVKGIIQYAGDLNREAETKFREKFEQMSSGLDNAHRVALLPIGYKYEAMGQKLVDAQFLENTQLNIRQIAAGFGIKMHQINDLGNATHTNVSEQNRSFYVDTLQPILNMYELEMDYKLFLTSEITSGVYAKFGIDTILRADIQTRYQSYQVAIQNGFKTPNEIRALEEDAPMEGADVLIVNGNMIPVALAGTRTQDNAKGGDNNGSKN